MSGRAKVVSEVMVNDGNDPEGNQAIGRGLEEGCATKRAEIEEGEGRVRALSVRYQKVSHQR